MSDHFLLPPAWPLPLSSDPYPAFEPASSFDRDSNEGGYIDVDPVVEDGDTR